MEQDDNALSDFYEMFNKTAISEMHVRTVGRSMGFNDDEISGMLEHLLDNGLLHEPIQGYFATTR